MPPSKFNRFVEPEESVGMLAVGGLLLAGAAVLAIIWFIALTAPF